MTSVGPFTTSRNVYPSSGATQISNKYSAVEDKAIITPTFPTATHLHVCYFILKPARFCYDRNNLSGCLNTLQI